MSRKNRATRSASAQAEATPATAPSVEHEEVVEQSTPPAEAERPVRPVGTSNLACTIRQHRHRYVPALAPSGKKTANNGDRVARILLVTPLEELAIFVATHFGKTYKHLNTGHERMCCGNIVRAAAKKGDVATLEWLDAREPQEAAA